MKECRLAVFCSGYGSNFQAILDAIRKKKLNASIALMVCDNPSAYALTRAKKDRVPVFLFNPKLFKSRKAYEKILTCVLKSQQTDLVVLAGFMRILTPYFVRTLRDRILNIHPSLLPRFKGAHAIRDAFEAGVKETGVTVHLVTEKVDAGPILLQKKVPVSKTDTLRSLETKIHRAEHRLYPLAVKKYISYNNRTSKLKEK
ncbi:MAG: phosphoribosylglycinamide formyltransferase [Candidatus Omnitrophica bacterium]|nr:phosphoribosylglycinamide formyltransferase [Candidatus Omnitrophota bacterium]